MLYTVWLQIFVIIVSTQLLREYFLRNYVSMGDIHYSRIRDTFALSPCAVGFALRNVREIYFLQMALGVFSVFVVR